MAESRISRPTELTPAAQETICRYLTAGNSFQTACEVAGIGFAAGKQWLQRGKNCHPECHPECHLECDTDDIYVAFAAAVQKAEAEAVARNVTLIHKVAADGSWEAAAWWLERRYPAEWGSPDRNMALIHKAAVDGSWQAAAQWLEHKYPAEWGHLDRQPGVKADENHHLGQGMSNPSSGSGPR